MAQLPDYLQRSLLGNVGTTICFSLGADDAFLMSRQFAPTIGAEDFQNLEKFQIILRLMIDGMSSQPFTAETLPPTVSEEDFTDSILENHAKHYTQAHKKVANMVTNTLAGK